MFRVLCVVIGYFVGSLQSAYFVGRFMKVDIRKHGSGNLGSTNALRVLGKRAGAVTFACDILKSVLAYMICMMLFRETGGYTAGLYACAGVVLGHDFPFYLKFKGGKGIASMIGMIFCIGWSNPLAILATFAIGILGLFTKYVSVGSICFSLSIPFVFYIFGYSSEFVIITAMLTALAVYRHRANIKRLINHSENKLGAKKEK